MSNFCSHPLAELSESKQGAGAENGRVAERAPDERKKGGERLKRKGEKSRRGLAAPSGAFVQLAKGPPRAGGNWWHHCVKHSGGRAGPLAAFCHPGNRSTRARCQRVCESMLCSDCLTSLFKSATSSLLFPFSCFAVSCYPQGILEIHGVTSFFAKVLTN